MRRQIADLEAELQSEIASMQTEGDPVVQEIAVRPHKADIVIERLALAWIPAGETPDRSPA